MSNPTSQPPPPQGQPVQPGQAGAWTPTAGQARLAEVSAGRCFTSDLSVNEFLLVREAGFEPLSMVVGSSMYHIGIQVQRWGQSQEIGVLTQAMYNGREAAMQRLIAEAAAVGADGVVGVRLDLNMYQGGHEIMEFMAVGTAVRSVNHPGAYRAPSGAPFTSDLTGQDFYTLVRTGHIPVSLVVGTCVYHVAHQSIMQTMRQVGQNVEMPQYTQAVYDARELAMGRMQAEAERDGGSGVVGVRLTHASHVWGEHAIEFFAIGTSIRDGGATPEPPAPSLVLPLS
jgi:uncharacterized protein YbjQ (UPF0145 family)